MQCSDPQEVKSIRSVTALGGRASGSLGAGASKPPELQLPKAEPFSGGGWGFTLLLTFPTAVPQAGAGAGLEDSFMEVTPPGALSGMRRAGGWLQRGWVPVCWGSGARMGGRGASGISLGEWWLPLCNATLVIFPIW